MSDILLPDQWEDYYKAEKQMDPDAPIVVKQFQRKYVEQVDRIIELAHGQRDEVKSASDWAVVQEIFLFFIREWPEEWKDFKNAIPQIRDKGDGYSKSKEIFHAGSIPPRLMRMMRAIFPAQQWDKKFTAKLIRKFPILKVGQA